MLIFVLINYIYRISSGAQETFHIIINVLWNGCAA